MPVRRCSDLNRFTCADLGACDVGALQDVQGGGNVGDFLTYDGSVWAPGPLDLADRLDTAVISDLGDVTETTPLLGQVLGWNGTDWGPTNPLAASGTFIAAQLSAATLNDLGDVTSSAATTGQVLVKQSGGQWTPQTLTPGVGSMQIARGRFNLAAPSTITVNQGQSRRLVAGPYTVTLNNPNPTSAMTVLRSCTGGGYVQPPAPAFDWSDWPTFRSNGGYLVWEITGTGVSGTQRHYWYAHPKNAFGRVIGGGSFAPDDASVPGNGTYSVTLNLYWEADPTGGTPAANLTAVLSSLQVSLVGIVG